MPDDRAAPLIDAVAGLCQARDQLRTDPRAAKATYDRRSRDGVHTTARTLQDSYSLLATDMSRAAELVEADLANEPQGASLSDNLARLTATMREGLARLGIPTDACEG